MSTQALRDPFEVVDAESEIALGGVAGERSAPRFETWLARGLLAVAIVLIVWVDLRLAGSTPNYGPGDEAYRMAVAEQVARHGTPPVLGKDFFVVDPNGPLLPRTVAIRQLEPPVGSEAPPVVAGKRYPQKLALVRPYPYYLAAPVSWVVDWRHRVFALRFLCIVLLCAGVGFLWAAVRESRPADPLAAGVAAVVLASMSGLIAAFAAIRPEALLFALWCAGMWLVLRDIRLRRPSVWTVAVWTAATCVSSVAVPMAIAAVALGAWRTERRGRALAARLAVVLAPTVVWVAWNLHAYGNPWPLDTGPNGSDRPRDWGRLTSIVDPVFRVNRRIFENLYNAGLEPLTHLDRTPAGFVAAAVAVALTMALVRGRIALARLALARFGVLLLASFASVYVTLFLSSVVAGLREVDASAANYGGYAAAWAGVVGIGFTAPLGGRRWLAPAAVAGLTIAVVSVTLRTPVA